MLVARAMRPILTTTLAFALALSPGARAESTICREGALAVTGEHTDQVLANCGSPSRRQSYAVRMRRGRPMVIEEWVYDLGEHTFSRFLRFENDVLVQVVVLSRNP
jgi:hypothetical protein